MNDEPQRRDSAFFVLGSTANDHRGAPIRGIGGNKARVGGEIRGELLIARQADRVRNNKHGIKKIKNHDAITKEAKKKDIQINETGKYNPKRREETE